MADNEWNACSTFDLAWDCILATVWLVVITISFIKFHDFFKKLLDRKEKIGKVYQYLGIMICIIVTGASISLFCYTCQYILYCLDILIDSSKVSQDTMLKYGAIWGSIAGISYYFGLLMLSLLFLVRLEETFKSTEFAFGKIVYITFFVLVIIDFIVAIIGLFLLNLTSIGYGTVATGLMGLSLFLYVIISFSLLILFVRSLFKLSNFFGNRPLTASHAKSAVSMRLSARIRNTNEVSTTTATATETGDGYGMRDHDQLPSGKTRIVAGVSSVESVGGTSCKGDNFHVQSNLVGVISKYFILSSLQLASSCLSAILWMLNASFYQTSWVPYYIFWSYMPLEYGFNVMSLLFQFKFYKKQYFKWCYTCDQCLQRKLLHIAVGDHDHAIQQTKQLQLMSVSPPMSPIP